MENFERRWDIRKDRSSGVRPFQMYETEMARHGCVFMHESVINYGKILRLFLHVWIVIAFTADLLAQEVTESI